MRARPPELDEGSLRTALAGGWGLAVDSLRYEPVGFGSHHWLARGDDAAWFVTVDDLAAKRTGAGDTTDAVFERLRMAFAAARALHDEAGLEFVLAPEPAADGSVVQRLGDRWSVVVHAFVEGRPAGSNGEYESTADRMAVAGLLVRLHGATGVECRREDGTLPRRDDLAAALSDVGRPWDRGPYGEPSRRLLAASAAEVGVLLGAYDGLAGEVLAHPERMVPTHGEPHAGNVLVTGGGLLLVDWDTALLAPPERDLWDLDPGDGSVLDHHRVATGAPPQTEALRFYRLWYDLAEIAGYISLFRHDHGPTADTAESWTNLRHFLQPRRRWPELFA